MSEHESFARVYLSELQSGTRVVVGGVSIEGAGQNEADKINAAFESAVSERVKKAVEEFRERAVGAAQREMLRSKSQEDTEWAQEIIANRISALPAV